MITDGVTGPLILFVNETNREWLIGPPPCAFDAEEEEDHSLFCVQSNVHCAVAERVTKLGTRVRLTELQEEVSVEVPEFETAVRPTFSRGSKEVADRDSPSGLMFGIHRGMLPQNDRLARWINRCKILVCRGAPASSR